MNHTQVLQRAWDTLWRYRALWLFGVILALTTFSWSPTTLYNLGRDGRQETGYVKVEDGPAESFTVIMGGPQDDEAENGRLIIHYHMPQDVARYRAGDVVVNVNVPGEVTAGIVQQDSTAPRSLRSLNVPPGFVGTAVALAGTLLAVTVVLLLVGLVVRYVAETALIAMVDHKEKSGQQVSFTQGWRWGWSPAAWRLFLIDLLVAIVVMAAFLVLALVVALPLLAAARTGNVSAILITAFSAGGLFFVLLFLGIVAGIVLSLLKPFFRRACVLEGLGVTAAIRQGTGIVRRHLKDAGLMWLIMLAIDLLWPLLLAPVALLLVAVALIVGGLTGTTFGAISALLTTGLTPWLIGVLAGASIFLAVLVAPLVFLGGLREVYQSTSWTLTYNELSALEKAQPVTRPKEALSGA